MKRILVLFLILFFINIISASTIYVNSSGGFNFLSIQQAIDNALSGDTVFVPNGVYNENITIGKSISLVGEDSENTIIRMTMAANIIKVVSSNVKISGFTIDNSSDTGIRVINSSNVSIIGNKITNNYNNGITLSGSAYATISNNYFENNWYNTIIVSLGSDHNLITGNVIRGPTMNGITSDRSSFQLISGNDILNSRKPAVSYNSYGISLYLSNWSTISDNNVTNNTLGLYIVGAYGNEVKGLRAIGNGDGIFLTHSENNNLSDNYMAGNGQGLYLFERVYNNVLERNFIEKNSRSAELDINADYNRFSNNYFKQNGGFYIEQAGRNIIENNVFESDGLFVFTDNNTFINNTANGLPILYLEGVSGMTIEQPVAQVIAVNSNNIIIRNLVFSNVPVGADFINTSNSQVINSSFVNNNVGVYLVIANLNTISGNSFFGSGIGVEFIESVRNRLSGNSFTSSGLKGTGVYLSDYSNYNSIEDSVFSGLQYGLYKETYWQRWGSSDFNNITGNKITGNGRGISIEAFENGVISNNNISGNGYGMSMSGTGDLVTGNIIQDNNATGLSYYGYYNEIKGNRINRNGWSGVSYGGDDNIFSGNEISSNINAGIEISGNNNNITGNLIKSNAIGLNDTTSYVGIYAVKNKVYNNFFSNSINARTIGNTYWNVSKTSGRNIVNGSFIGGNYWNNYNGTDVDGDGIGDTNIPYNSGGFIVGGDYLPLISHIPYNTCGDTDNNGVIDVIDVVKIINVAFRGVAPTEPLWVWNVDGDSQGAIDVIDVVKIINVAFRGANSSTEFSCNKPMPFYVTQADIDYYKQVARDYNFYDKVDWNKFSSYIKKSNCMLSLKTKKYACAELV